MDRLFAMSILNPLNPQSSILNPRSSILSPERSGDRPAAVDDQRMTGDERGCVRGQEQQCACELVGAADAVEAGALFEALQELAILHAVRPVVVGIRKRSRQDGVGADA